MSIIGNQYLDNAVLYSGTINSISIGSPIDTTGYATTVWQISGNTFSGIILIEGSLDGTYWSPILVSNLSELGLKTQIDGVGVYLVKIDTRYVRYNIQNISGSATLVVSGNDSVSSSPSDRLSLAMDLTNNSPLYVSLTNPLKSDIQGAALLSDAPIGINTPVIAVDGGVAASPGLIVDCTGYQSIGITTQSFAGSVYGSNDQISWSAVLGYSISTALALSAIVATSNYIFPCLTRYIKFVATTSGTLTYYLRSQPFTNAHVNLQQVGSAAVSQATSQLGMNLVNLAGTAIPATGAAVGGSPLPVGAVDPANLLRKILSDSLGRLQIATQINIPAPTTILASTTTNVVGSIPLVAGTLQNQPALNVQDTSLFEGQSQIEVLSQILLELKILNQQIFELPRILTIALQGSPVPVPIPIIQLGDEPAQMRAEPSLFSNQQ